MKTFILALLTASPAAAGVPCFGIPDAIAALHLKGYEPKFEATLPDAKLEVWVNEQASFMVLYIAGNQACFVQSGEDWKQAGTGA